jgi:hypothetical protein
LERKTFLIHRIVYSAFLILLVLFSAKLVYADDITSGSTEKPEIPYDGEVPLVPSVRPVIILKGTDYEMGYQHARQLIQIFGTYYMEGAAKAKWPVTALAVIKKSETYIKKYTPWAIDYIKGMTDGCIEESIPMIFIQLLAQFVDTGTSPDPEPSECSGWAAWGTATKDGRLICGGSGDHEIRPGSKSELRYEVNVMFFPESGYNYIFSPPSGGSGHPGVNNKGVVNVHHGTSGYYDRYMNPDLAYSGEGVPRVFLLMHCLRFAESAEQAMNIALSIPNPGGRQGGFWPETMVR